MSRPARNQSLKVIIGLPLDPSRLTARPQINFGDFHIDAQALVGLQMLLGSFNISLNINRLDIIQIVGRDFLVTNIENGEFSYQQVLDRSLSGHYKLDIRFVDETNRVAVLIETKRRFNLTSDIEQLFSYVALEQELNPDFKIIAILANTSNDNIKVWKLAPNEESVELKVRVGILPSSSSRVQGLRTTD